VAEDYPTWLYYPNRAQPPAWVETFIGVVRDQRPAIESARVEHLTSDVVLSHMAPGLAAAGYVAETGKKRVRRSDGRCCSGSKDGRASPTRSTQCTTS
jgi:hypothetical protein